MTAIEWDQAGERFYQGGVDRGVLYLSDGRVAPWNGLTSLEESSDSELKAYYLDGIKFMQTVTPGDFAGKLSAFTYPPELDEVIGIASDEGMSYYEQPTKSFGLSYRTRIGNDQDADLGYKIHILYNLVAVPEAKTFQTLGKENAPGEFSWSLTGTPPRLSGKRPTAHVSFDSRDTNPVVLTEIERILYGTDSREPYLPSIPELESVLGLFAALLVVDNGDGTWTAYDSSDTYISMIDDTTFRISNVNADYINPFTYTLTDTFAPNTDDPPFTSLFLKVSDTSTKVITMTTDGTFDVNETESGGAWVLDHILMQSPDLGVCRITATEDDTLEVAPTTMLDANGPYLQKIRMASSDGAIWAITATDDDSIDISLD